MPRHQRLKPVGGSHEPDFGLLMGSRMITIDSGSEPVNSAPRRTPATWTSGFLHPRRTTRETRRPAHQRLRPDLPAPRLRLDPPIRHAAKSPASQQELWIHWARNEPSARSCRFILQVRLNRAGYPRGEPKAHSPKPPPKPRLGELQEELGQSQPRWMNPGRRTNSQTFPHPHPHPHSARPNSWDRTPASTAAQGAEQKGPQAIPLLLVLPV
jgi:hypothetical protein